MSDTKRVWPGVEQTIRPFKYADMKPPEGMQNFIAKKVETAS